jgi:hypothetical protein
MCGVTVEAVATISPYSACTAITFQGQTAAAERAYVDPGQSSAGTGVAPVSGVPTVSSGDPRTG